MIEVGDQVVFTGHGSWRSNQYNYPKLFGDVHHLVTGIKESCCNRFIIVEGINGMYNADFFTRLDVQNKELDFKTQSKEEW